MADTIPRQRDEAEALLSHTPSNCNRNREIRDKNVPAKNLNRNPIALLLVVIYSACAIFAWTVLVIQSHRPIGGYSYGAVINENNMYDLIPEHYSALYNKNEKYYRAARIINAGVGSLTIPLAMAVCARAAVTYAQRQRHGFMLRKAMTLADQGWLNVDVWCASSPSLFMAYSTFSVKAKDPIPACLLPTCALRWLQQPLQTSKPISDSIMQPIAVPSPRQKR